ncbi:MAG: hypothetical protein DMG29_00055 [Acidobacteria bacterium]|nr:MAG: hypothetical protein DMG29_00055 [Acidobacteriota bacterium]
MVLCLAKRQELMKHFELAEWTDFVRGLVEKSARLPMEHHLASGCRKCRHTADLLRKLVTAAYALRCARAVFLLQQPEKIQILCQRACSTTVSANPCPQVSAPSSA